MRIILAEPPAENIYSTPNLGLLYIASYVRSVITNVQLKYLSSRYQILDHIKAINSFKPDIYAISFTSYQAFRAYSLIKVIKIKYPWIKIVCGGAHTSVEPEEVIEKSRADVCVIGEGEHTFGELVRKTKGLPESADGIAGVVYLTNGGYVRTECRPLIEEIDRLPLPAHDLIILGSLPIQKGFPCAEMCVARGCLYHCTFCSQPVFRVKGQPLLRKRSPQFIAAEAKQLYKMGCREIYLHSDQLNCDHDWAIEVCEALAALRYEDLFFQTNIRADAVTGELAKAMKKMNCWLARIGVESANNRVLKGIKKLITLEQIESALSLLAEHGIRIFGFMMMFQVWERRGNLEYETPEEVKYSINWSRRMIANKQLHYIGWKPAIPVPGAELYNIAKRRGWLKPNFCPGDLWDVSWHIPEISSKEWSVLLKEGTRLQAKAALMNGSINWRNLPKLLNKIRKVQFKPRKATVCNAS